MNNPIYLAIDTPEFERAADLVVATKDYIGGVKLGLEYFCAEGRRGVEAIATIGLPIFLDLKFHDIPNTVAKAISALGELTPSILTVHAGGGREMMRAAKEAAPEGTKVVGVTVLTSLNEYDLAETGIAATPENQVLRLTSLAKEAGLDGIVCSPLEVESAALQWPTGFFVVPGIRPEGSNGDDQKRVMTPRVAQGLGASALVIGRPITAAPDPVSAAKAILQLLNNDA